MPSKTRLSAEAKEDIVKERKAHGDKPGVGKLIDRLAKRYRVNKSTIQYYIQMDKEGRNPRTKEPVVAVTKSRKSIADYRNPSAVISKTDFIDYVEPQAELPAAPDHDGLADMLNLQLNIWKWNDEIKEEIEELKELELRVKYIIQALQDQRHILEATEERDGYRAKLNGATQQIDHLERALQRQRDEWLNRVNQQTHGE